MSVIGVIVIAGFLGSGKTTLLSRLVRDARIGPRTAVIVNELGALGLDEELIGAEMQTPSLHMRQLVSGCICCTLRGDLSSALLELAARQDRPPPEHILIETSGAARATEVSYAINAIGFEAPFRTDAVVTLVDAHNAGRAHREHEDLFEDQVRAADVLLLNKADLLPDEAGRAALLAWLRPLAPRATLAWTVHADVDPALLVGADEAPGPPALPVPQAGHDHGEHGAAGAAHGLSALTLPAPQPLRRDALEDLLEDLASSVFRVKGVVDVQKDGRLTPVLVQAVGDRIEIDEIDLDAALASSRRRLIFIGSDLDEKGLREGLIHAQAD